ncbi:hypothetical protein Pcinc_029046 [Petrolisthes cinctipes]|uniref:Uncharacterized protein n=1 Tax=Petrolisthes cinctipes TaxID=88211 RepID=A0AAE1K6B4_PETCI|nr:hypothetical protein Pcinc_029046 [Petrolisthes cinctipes]
MADPQTDWEVCGQRRSRAHRVAELVALREEQRQVALDRRRIRLRALLKEEEARLQNELQIRLQHYQQQESPTPPLQSSPPPPLLLLYHSFSNSISSSTTPPHHSPTPPHHSPTPPHHSPTPTHHPRPHPPPTHSLTHVRQLADRQQVATAAREKEEEARLRQVEVADEQRQREASHQYREEYWRQVQRYINETRPLDIALRNHIRNTYGLQVKKH